MFKGDINPPKGSGISYRYEHYYCDFVEVIALVNSGDIVTLSDIKYRFQKDVDLNIDSNEEMEIITDDENCFSEMTQGGRYFADVSDKWDERIESWFSILKNRNSLYGMGYPFTIKGNSIQLKKNLSTKAKSYIFLLACSMLDKFETPDKLTSTYELICAKAMKNYLPVIAQVHIFGKSSLSSPRYQGSKFAKIEKLSKDLGIKHIFDETDYNPTDNGDGGLDIVAWIPFKNDINKSKIDVYIGQCASGKDWIKKQEEPRKIIEPLPQLKDAKKIIFIPYDIRSSDSGFFHKTELTASLVIDRYRTYILLNNISDSWFFSTTNIKELVANIISYRESLF
ncbi:hypothetical protein Q4551_08990 [Oceanobacter sp. 5_MG-2023]|jgi:hypothetical protein|uniref:hypothetical protein n=1 Tax=Oceanobacter sp. 5_MG-2023 TaxID=3062645 RepID=UPI0026E2635C|nr:hypothetical protein [Oceanobacter sp. 5_MG-2023]MDO6682424.1 hypothetical protein [Oceanobacter sp. 5_MG-2023]